MESIITPIALAHGVEPETLAKVLANHGWDFTPLATLTGDEAATCQAFATRIITDKAVSLADIKARRLAREAQAAAADEARKTAAAKANPTRVCSKCSGAGRVSWATHVEKGRCFWCGGTGIIRQKEARQ